MVNIRTQKQNAPLSRDVNVFQSLKTLVRPFSTLFLSQQLNYSCISYSTYRQKVSIFEFNKFPRFNYPALAIGLPRDISRLPFLHLHCSQCCNINLEQLECKKFLLKRFKKRRWRPKLSMHHPSSPNSKVSVLLLMGLIFKLVALSLQSRLPCPNQK